MLFFSHSVVSDTQTPWTAACQASLSFVIWSLLKLIFIKLVMPPNHLVLCHSLLLLPSIFPSIRVFSKESALCIRWPQYWRFTISPSNEYSGLVFFRIDWLHPHTKSKVKNTIKLGSPEPAELKDRDHWGRIPLRRAQGATSLHSK